MRTILVILLLILSLAAMSSCTTTPKNEIPLVLQPVASRFKEIPVPKTFNSLPQNTYAFENVSFGVRFGTARYEGFATFDQVLNFYKDEMPKHGWTLANSAEFGGTLLNYTRKDEICIINITGQANLITIAITLGPKPQNLLEKLN